MDIDKPVLLIEINESNYVFVACTYDENQNLKIAEKIVAPSAGILKNKFINIEKANEEINTVVFIILFIYIPLTVFLKPRFVFFTCFTIIFSRLTFSYLLSSMLSNL